MPDDHFVLLTVELAGKPSLKAAARKLKIAAKHFDTDYGVVALDPDKSLFGVRVKQAAVHPGGGSTPYSDPKIHPFD